MKTKHTSGSWKADIENCGDGLNVVRVSDNAPVCHTAAVRTSDYTRIIPDEAKANARLIAAAPELLEALESLEAVASWTAHNNPRLSEEIVNARAAIAKAKGE